MNFFIKHIPNTITCLNLWAGCLACIAAFKGQFEAVALCLAFSAFFDFCDGLSARLLQAYSPLGKELDSLADMVSFGLVPGLIVFFMLGHSGQPGGDSSYSDFVPYIAFLIPIFSALRLAKFNIDDRQTQSFIGLATPANAIFWLGVSFLYKQYAPEWTGTIALVIATILFSLLMVAEFPMFSLKLKSLSWRESHMQYLLLAGSVLFLIIFGIGGLAPTILWYILLALINNTRKKTK